MLARVGGSKVGRRAGRRRTWRCQRTPLRWARGTLGAGLAGAVAAVVAAAA